MPDVRASAFRSRRRGFLPSASAQDVVLVANKRVQIVAIKDADLRAISWEAKPDSLTVPTPRRRQVVPESDGSCPSPSSQLSSGVLSGNRLYSCAIHVPQLMSPW